MIHLFEYDDESDQLQNIFNFTHPHEITSITTSPSHPDKCFTTYFNQNTQTPCATLWQFPPLHEADSLNLDMTEVCSIPVPGADKLSRPTLTDPSGPLPPQQWSHAYQVLTGSLGFTSARLQPFVEPSFVSIVWNKDSSPAAASKLLAVSNVSVALHDLERPSTAVSTTPLQAQPVTACQWHGQREGASFITASGSSLIHWDVRTMKPTFALDFLHQGGITSFAVNPNRPYTVLTGGADGGINVWDCRQAQSALATTRGHDHHVTSVDYHPGFDQLVVSGGNDAQVLLWTLPSASAAPAPVQSPSAAETSASLRYTHTENSNRIVSVNKAHGDRVSCVRWIGEWSYASVGADGRILVQRVPTDDKYKLML
jgi:WD40 repeat protein